MAYHQSTSQVDNGSVTVTLDDDETHNSSLQSGVATFRLKLKKPKSSKKVNWTEETVDNENMDKKKSKCCCIYKKHRAPGDSSSSDDDDDNECEHCYGHVEKSKRSEKSTPSPASAEPSAQSMIAA